MTDRRRRALWLALWKQIQERTMLSEPAAKHAAAIAIDYLERKLEI